MSKKISKFKTSSKLYKEKNKKSYKLKSSTDNKFKDLKRTSSNSFQMQEEKLIIKRFKKEEIHKKFITLKQQIMKLIPSDKSSKQLLISFNQLQ